MYAGRHSNHYPSDRSPRPSGGRLTSDSKGPRLVFVHRSHLPRCTRCVLAERNNVLYRRTTIALPGERQINISRVLVGGEGDFRNNLYRPMHGNRATSAENVIESRKM